MKRSPETRARISASLMGHPVSAETRAKMRAAAQRRRHSAETRAKISAVQRLNPPQGEVALMVRLYQQMGVRPLALRMGYNHHLVARVLREQGVALRPAGFQRRDGVRA